MTLPPQICPACGRALPDAFNGGACPACGHNRRESLSKEDWKAWGWMLFWIVLLAPAALTFGTLDLRNPGAGAGIPIVGSLISAVICGTWTSLRVSSRVGIRILTAILLIGPFFLLSFFLCFIGCAARGAMR